MKTQKFDFQNIIAFVFFVQITSARAQTKDNFFFSSILRYAKRYLTRNKSYNSRTYAKHNCVILPVPRVRNITSDTRKGLNYIIFFSCIFLGQLNKKQENSITHYMERKSSLLRDTVTNLNWPPLDTNPYFKPSLERPTKIFN